MAYNKLVCSTDEGRDLVQAWKDYANHYRDMKFSIKGDYDKAISFAEKDEAINKSIDVMVGKLCGLDCSFVNREQYATNPTFVWSYNSVINTLVDMILPDILRTDFAGIAEIRDISAGDSAEFTVKSADLFRVSKAGNSRRRVGAQRKYTGNYSITPENHIITTDVDFYRVAAGKESPAQYAMEVILSFEEELAKDIMAALVESYNTLTANFKHAGFDEPKFKEIATRVTGANGGAKAVCVGTDVALGNVVPSETSYKMQLGEEMTKVGYLDRFKGVPLMSITQKIDWASEDYGFALPDDKLFFISPAAGKLVKVVLEGGTLTIAENQFGKANLTQATTLQKRWGVALISSAKHGIMSI